MTADDPEDRPEGRAPPEFAPGEAISPDEARGDIRQTLEVPIDDRPRSAMAERGRELIGERLLKHRLITPDQLEVALHEKRRSNKMLGAILVDFGFLSEADLSAALSEATGFAEFNPATAFVDPDVIALVPKDVALRYRVLPVSMSEDRRFAQIAMADPYDVLALDQVRSYLPRGVEIEPRICTPVILDEAIDRFYGYEMSIDGILAELSGAGYQGEPVPGEEEGYTHPVVRLVNAILLDAVKQEASDIHFEPEEQFLRLRYRIDGVLEQIRAFHKDYWPGLAHRIKILAGMNIADRRTPQDGRFTLSLGHREMDFRVATMPTAHGENIVLRVLDKSRALMKLENLGFSDEAHGRLMDAIARPEGIVIVTGPTGCGKTTTLYAALDRISSVNVNIMTLENPIEYQMPLIRQTQIREESGLTFDRGAVHLLRQDPDIVFLGEVRDAQTAQMALRAAMTGHQVYTTLHTTDAVGAIPRLFDLGLHPGLLAGNIIGVVAQRLVRRLCPACKRSRPATESERVMLASAPAPASPETETKTEAERRADPDSEIVLWEPVGCAGCRQTGYRGRTALVEVLLVDENLDEIVARAGNRAELKSAALAAGFRPMVEEGLAKVRAGVTSLDELGRAVDLSRRK